MDTLEFLQLVDILVTGFVAYVGWRVANSLRHHTRVQTLEARVHAYKALWAKMKLTTPSRREKWHVPPPQPGYLRPDERRELFQALIDWYYEDGNGIFLTESAGGMYLAVKQNLVCEDEDLDPSTLLKVLGLDNSQLRQDERDEIRGNVCLRQLSLLRFRMRGDLELYGIEHYIEDLTPSDVEFLKGKGQDLDEEPWCSLKMVQEKHPGITHHIHNVETSNK